MRNMNGNERLTQCVTLTCVEYSGDELLSSKLAIPVVIHAPEDVENA